MTPWFLAPSFLCNWQTFIQVGGYLSSLSFIQVRGNPLLGVMGTNVPIGKYSSAVLVVTRIFGFTHTFITETLLIRTVRDWISLSGHCNKSLTVPLIPHHSIQNLKCFDFIASSIRYSKVVTWSTVEICMTEKNRFISDSLKLII